MTDYDPKPTAYHQTEVVDVDDGSNIMGWIIGLLALAAIIAAVIWYTGFRVDADLDVDASVNPVDIDVDMPSVSVDGGDIDVNRTGREDVDVDLPDVDVDVDMPDVDVEGGDIDVDVDE